MNRDEATALVRSLLERIDSNRPEFVGLVSSMDREALAELAGAGPSAGPQPSVVPTVHLNIQGLTNPVGPANAVLCLDFGTAKSKASATYGEDLIPLPLGQMDGDVDGSVFAVSSSLWIDDDGLVFVGAEAFRRGERRAADGRRQRLDSIKQFVSQAESVDLLTFTALTTEQNPTSTKVTLDDVLTLYLAYLTDLAGAALTEQGLGRYVPRRFSLPCWRQDQRAWAAPYLAKLVGRAQLLADTFHGRWPMGIPVDEVVAAVAQTKNHDSEALRWLIADDGRPTHHMQRWGGVLEPLAAGSASVWRERGRELVLVVDVGAGTTDFSIFLISHGHEKAQGHRAIPVNPPMADAVRFAGDHVDDILLSELLRCGHMDPAGALATQARVSVRLSGLRRIKERLFLDGRVEVSLSSDVRVTIERDQFLASAGLRGFEEQLHARVKAFLERVDKSFAPLFQNIALVLTGGGRDLPMIASLAESSWIVHGFQVHFRSTPRVPPAFADYGAPFAREYPQLAVALGGALPDVLDEREGIATWAGGAPVPGKLSRFQTTGL